MQNDREFLSQNNEPVQTGLMHNRTFLTGTLAALALSLAACGGDDSGNGGSPGSSSSSDESSSSSSSSESSASSSSAAAEGWTLVWSDEFDGDEINTDNWSHEVNCYGGGNNELQCYTDRPENSYVEDGYLHLVAKQETHSGPAHFDDHPDYDPDDTSVQRDYTSARLRTKNLADWQYGRLEINAKIPQGQGIWPAIWMLPTEEVYGGWPLSGEIDIFEAVNANASGGNEIHGTLHYGLAWPGNLYSGTAFTPEEPIWENFHTYAVEWEEGEIRWYIDDTHYATQTQDGWFTYYWGGQEVGYQVGEGAAPFDQLFHLILNVAVGGDWPGAPNDQTQFPQEMVVDYVRVYECAENPETGKGCATRNADAELVEGYPAPEQQSFKLYDGGPATLEFEVAGQSVTNTLVPGFYEESPGNVVTDPGATHEGETVWDLMFNGGGNAFLGSESMDEEPALNDGFKLTSLENYGEIRFDLWVESIEAETELLIKLDSAWPNVSHYAIDVPEPGEWTSVSVPIKDLEPNNIEPGAVDLNQVINAFVIEPQGGTAHVKLKNIRLVCPGDCAIEPVYEGVSAVLDESFDVYVDGEPGVNWDFGVGTWDDDTGHVSTATVNDPDRGDVLEVSFSESNNNGLVFVQANSGKDVTAFSDDGQLNFDVKVLDYGTNTSGLAVRIESGPNIKTGDYVIEPTPALGEWTSVSIAIPDMLDEPGISPGFDMSEVNSPFVFFPVWEDQSGVRVQLDNIRWVR